MGSWQAPSATPGPGAARGNAAFLAGTGLGGAGGTRGMRPHAWSGLGAAEGAGQRFPARPAPTPGSLRPSRPLPWPGRPRLAGAGPVTSPIHTAAQLAPPGRSPRQRGRRSAGNDFQLPARGSAPGAASASPRSHPRAPHPRAPHSPAPHPLPALPCTPAPPQVLHPCPAPWAMLGDPRGKGSREACVV